MLAIKNKPGEDLISTKRHSFIKESKFFEQIKTIDGSPVHKQSAASYEIDELESL